MHKIREASGEKNSLLDRHIACICLQVLIRSGMGHDGFGVDYGVIDLFEGLGGTKTKDGKNSQRHWLTPHSISLGETHTISLLSCPRISRQSLRTPQDSKMPVHCSTT
jgi:hypothetical protein